MIRHPRTRAALFVAALAVAAPLIAQVPAPARARTAAALPQKVTSVEGITEYRLSNGLRVLLFPDQSKQTTTVNITYFVGSKHENNGETGMAHLLEHLVFKGSPRHRNIPQELTEHGASPNGTTWLERTNYFETFPSTDANIEWALDLEADRMVNSFIAKKDLDSEMTVVRNEFESGENSPFNVLLQRTVAASYLWHNYGQSTIGARSDLENVPIDRLQAFYRKYYQPDNAMLVVAGRFDEGKVLRLVQQKFGRIPRPTRKLATMYTLDPTQDGEREVTLRRVGDTQMLHAVYHIPAASHPDFAAVDILSEVLGDTPSGRLHKALVETKKAASVGAFGFPLRDPGILLLYAEVSKDASLGDARTAFVQAIEELPTRRPTAEEVERARIALLKNIELQFNNSQAIAIELSEFAAVGDWRMMFIHRDRLKKVTTEEVGRVAQTYFKPSNRTLGQFIPTPKPDRSEIPPTPDVVALVKDYKGEAAVATGEAFDPSPSNIDKRTTRSALPNGFEIALLNKETRGNTVVAQLVLRLGSEKTLMNRGAAGDLAAAMLMRGTKTKTREQLKDAIDKLKARVNVSGSATQVTAQVETTNENLPAVLKLVAEIVREPGFDAKEFDILKNENIVGLESQKSEPNALGSIAFQRTIDPWPKGHPRYTGTFDEEIGDIRSASLADVQKFYADFYGAEKGTLAVVGDFDQAAVMTAVTQAFGSWKAANPFERIAAPAKPVASTTLVIETPDKEQAFYLTGLTFPLSDRDPEYPALLVGNYLMGGGFLNSRIVTRLRQKDGLSYGAGSQFQAHPLDKAGQFVAYAIYAPQNVVKLETGFREELERALKDGFTADEVEKGKTGLLEARKRQRAQDPTLASQLTQQLYWDRTAAFDAEIDRAIAALTPTDIVGAMRKFIDPSRLVVVKAGDFAGKKADVGPATP